MCPLRGPLRISVIVAALVTLEGAAVAGDDTAPVREPSAARTLAAAELKGGNGDDVAAPLSGSASEIALVTGDGQQGAPAITTLVLCPASDAGCTP